MLERDIEKKIGLYAKQQGCEWIKFTSPARRAVPDRLILGPGGVVGFLEIKRKGEKPTPLQMRELMRLRELGMNVGWVDNVADGRMFIDLLVAKRAGVVMGRGLVG